MAVPSDSLRRLFPAFLLLLFFSGNGVSARQCGNCGSFPVPYPLRTAPDCGDQLYKIRCTGGRLFFDTLNNTYPISSVDPNSQRLTIEPAPFLPDTCVTEDISTGGIQLNSSLPFNITGSNTILFLNCTEALFDSPLNCSSDSACHAYINGSLAADNPVGACANAPVCCSFKAGGSTTAHRLRVRVSGCRAYRAFVNLDESLPVGQWPKPALELEWASPPQAQRTRF